MRYILCHPMKLGPSWAAFTAAPSCRAAITSYLFDVPS